MYVYEILKELWKILCTYICIFICSINIVLMPLLGRDSSRLEVLDSWTLHVSCLIILLFQLTQLALMALTSLTEAFLFTLFLFAPFFLELVAFGYQPLGLSPVTGW